MSSFDLIAATNLHMTRARFPSTREVHYYPSSASAVVDGKVYGTCLRNSWYYLQKDIPRTPTQPSAQWAAKLGLLVEDLLLDNWKEMGIWVADHVKWYDKERNVSGELDAIIIDPDGNQLVVEVKTFWGYYATKEICGNTRQQGKPKREHLMQTSLYLDHFRSHGLPNAKLMYYARDSANRAEFDVTLVDENGLTYPVINGVVDRTLSMQDIYARYQELDEHLKNKIEPARDYVLEYDDATLQNMWDSKELSKTRYDAWQKKGERPGDWNCGYCKYKNHCWK